MKLDFSINNNPIKIIKNKGSENGLRIGKALEKYRYLDGHYIISIDGTGQYSSEKVHCDCCCEKHHRNSRVEYYHQNCLPMSGRFLWCEGALPPRNALINLPLMDRIMLTNP